MNYQEIDNWQNLAELKNLHNLSTPPKKLYFQGNWNPKIFENCTAVVGSRRMTDYGRRVVEKIIPQLIIQKQTIVSGFMYGIDQYTHQICCEGGGKTIAVLGWGINHKLTGYDAKLAGRIIDSGGILLSEWESQPPTHWTFPARNRIVAGLSKQVLVVEAAENSGSLITARIAKNLKREVWAVPGPITSRTSAGTNGLIAKGLAKMYPATAASADNLPTNDPILQALDQESLTADEISRKLELSVSQVGAQLSFLLLSGAVSEIGGKYYINDAN